ncbi:hypothetical protein DTO027B5_3684 [Paecilomyces variotii]|nr:hypothetical protein DTO169C6_7140 [Paecilomyces variotii]KAJ9262373.1 hypothetical protein DTO212C5_7928 [Paecilomyces variotii]KAJ9326101.1 hypothetical protein DTO027B3_3077 [Paecilomyces variotii]KAJ9334447.1 hypothetical protein DTO027B5_3684 [Paecilomyces variotii]KAJ9357665.1 hypothetical protein DTO027B9_2983 [Paecilomyces variotii]
MDQAHGNTDISEGERITALPPTPAVFDYPNASVGGLREIRSARRSRDRRRRIRAARLQLESLEGRQRVYERFFSSLGEARDPSYDDCGCGITGKFAYQLGKWKQSCSELLIRILAAIKHRSSPEEHMNFENAPRSVHPSSTPSFSVVRNGKFRHHYDHDIEPRVKLSAVEPEPPNDVLEERGRPRHRHLGSRRRDNNSLSVRRRRSVG